MDGERGEEAVSTSRTMAQARSTVSTYPHPVRPLGPPAETLDAEAEACLARVAFALLVAFLSERAQGRKRDGRVLRVVARDAR